MLLKSKKNKIILESKIYTLDIETDSYGEIIDIGFYDGSECLFFDNWNHFLFHLKKIKSGIIYAHNGGGFDYVNFLIYLFKNKMRFYAMLKNSKIFSFYMLDFPDIKFVDSFTLLPLSLKEISESFSELLKLDIEDSLYADMRKFKLENEKNYYAYLQRDCVVLYQAITKLKSMVNAIYNLVNLPLSIGGVSMRLFIKKFLRHNMMMPSDSEKKYTFNGYSGGRCEYLGFGKKSIIDGYYHNVNGYDFNSHYPNQMLLRDYPIRRGVFVNNFIYDKEGLVSSGIYHSKYIQKHGRIPILQSNNNYEFEGEGYYSHFELNEIIKNGGKIYCFSGYHYNFLRPIFYDFVNYFFDSRLLAIKNNDNARNLLFKLILNNLYGKFGQRDKVESLQILSETERYEMIKTCKINEFFRIGDDYAFYEVTKSKKCFTSFPAIAAMITSSGRIELCKLLENCENPIYCDTDSIHCQNDLPDEILGNGLGKMKIEFYQQSARYGGKKSYEIKNTKFCQKGIPKNKLDEKFFNDLFNNNFVSVDFQRPLLLKSAIRNLDVSPSMFQKFTRTVKTEKSYFEKNNDNLF